jgi:hypothetical protein
LSDKKPVFTAFLDAEMPAKSGSGEMQFGGESAGERLALTPFFRRVEL